MREATRVIIQPAVQYMRQAIACRVSVVTLSVDTDEISERPLLGLPGRSRPCHEPEPLCLCNLLMIYEQPFR